jgi:hypothetical protein
MRRHKQAGCIRIHVGEVGKGLTDHQRRTLIGQWSAVRNVYEEYAEKLTAEQLEGISPFFIKPLTDRRKLARHTPWAGVHREQQERVKNKTDAVQQQFYRVRYVAGIRCNQVRRLYTAVTEAIAFVEKKHRTDPHEFSYEETVQTLSGRSVRQRVELTLWDAVSIREHAIGLGYKEAPGTTRQRRWREGRYAAARVPHFVEYNATVSLERSCGAEPFWFLEFFRHRVFRRVEARVDSDVADKRGELSAINRLIVAEEAVPVERRYSFPVGIFAREVKGPPASSDLGKGQRRERDPHGHDTVYPTFPGPGQPQRRLGQGGRGSYPAPMPDL